MKLLKTIMILFIASCAFLVGCSKEEKSSDNVKFKEEYEKINENDNQAITYINTINAEKNEQEINILKQALIFILSACFFLVKYRKRSL